MKLRLLIYRFKIKLYNNMDWDEVLMKKIVSKIKAFSLKLIMNACYLLFNVDLR